MRRLFGASIAAAVLAGGSAVAADLRVYKPPPIPHHDWRGCYVGVTGGGVWGQSKHVSGGPVVPGADITTWYDASGGIFGATWGCNYRLGSGLTFGTDSDFSFTSKRGSANDIPPFNVAATAGTREHWLSTSRLRLGATPTDRTLLYITGGLARGRIEATVNIPGVGQFSDTHTRWGWTIGVGAEHALGARWSVKAEYLYASFSDRDYFNPSPSAFVAVRSNVPLDNHILRVGVNYNVGCVLLCALFANY
jgi:outer membrane immunogenic protein